MTGELENVNESNDVAGATAPAAEVEQTEDAADVSTEQ